MQLVYSAETRRVDFTADVDGELKRYFEVHGRPDEDTRNFMRHLLEGVLSHWDELDAAIAGSGSNWQIHRIGRVEKSIMRVAVFEMEHPDLNGEITPLEIVIDEAVELAKIFGTDDAPAFVNGVLDAIAVARSVAKNT